MSHDGYCPISDYALLSDCRSWALVSSDGWIDWCNFHEAGQHPVFSRILDVDRGGGFHLGVDDPDARRSRRYLPGSNVLETRYETDSGVLVVTDALAVSERETPVPISLWPHDLLVREARCEQGEVTVSMTVEPRFDYGLTRPRMRLEPDGRAVAYGSGDAVVVVSELPLERRDWHGCGAQVQLQAGQERRVGLSYVLPHRLRYHLQEPEADLGQRLQETIEFWERWSARCTYEGPYRDAVLRSALVLKGLTDAETGAIVAAPTTSLPEEPGGERNWDYRYTWIRDAAMHLEALFGLGYREEAGAFLHYLERTTAGTAEDLQVMYGSRGQKILPEIEVAGLEGYRGSRPVRIGNDAALQYQTDSFGQLLDTAWRYCQHDGLISPDFAHLLRDAVTLLAERWRDPDHGIWEVRTPPQRFVSSGLFAWVAVDRAVRLADEIGLEDRDRYEELGSKIRSELLEHGVDRDTGAFRRHLDGNGADASNLLIALQGMLDPRDERITATLDQIRKRLAAEPQGRLLWRYLGDDGLHGGEGAFVLCSFWLVSVLAARHELDEATEVFEHTLSYANDLGLLAEEIDPSTGELLGNFPQAISHAGLITAALELEAARQQHDGPSDQPAPWASEEEGDHQETPDPEAS